MSLLPMLFSDWWEDLDRPHRLWDQHFGTTLDPDDLLSDLDSSAEVLLYRPHRRMGRRYHPFLKGIGRRHGRGSSIVQPDKNKFQVSLDVAQFAPDEINVKVVDQTVVVEAKHDEKEDQHGWISRQFVRKYIVPSQCDIDRVETHLSSDGMLSISAPRKEAAKSETNERILKIHYTGKPALANCDEKENEEQQQSQQRGPQQQQQQPQQQQQQQQQQGQQQHQRGRKGIVKAA